MGNNYFFKVLLDNGDFIYVEVPYSVGEDKVVVLADMLCWLSAKLVLNNLEASDVIVVDDNGSVDYYRDVYVELTDGEDASDLSKEDIIGEMTLYDYYTLDISDLVGRFCEVIVYVGDDNTLSTYSSTPAGRDDSIWGLSRGINPVGPVTTSKEFGVGSDEYSEFAYAFQAEIDDIKEVDYKGERYLAVVMRDSFPEDWVFETYTVYQDKVGDQYYYIVPVSELGRSEMVVLEESGQVVPFITYSRFQEIERKFKELSDGRGIDDYPDGTGVVVDYDGNAVEEDEFSKLFVNETEEVQFRLVSNIELLGFSLETDILTPDDVSFFLSNNTDVPVCVDYVSSHDHLIAGAEELLQTMFDSDDVSVHSLISYFYTESQNDSEYGFDDYDDDEE